MAPRMTGIGCYGKPMHLAQTLARALTRFGLSSSDLLSIAWRPDPLAAGCGRPVRGGHRYIQGGKAVVMLSQYDRVVGFFLWAAESGPRLHVHTRDNGKCSGPMMAR